MGQKIKLIPKAIGNRKRDCAWGCCSGDKHHLRKFADRKAQISSVSGTNAFLICAFRSADFLGWCLSPRWQPHAQISFLFPIVLVLIMNLIHFFDEKKDGAAGNSIILFCSFDPLSRNLTVRIFRRMRTVSKSATFLAQKE